MNKVFFVKPPETFITKANRNKHLRSTVFLHVNFILQTGFFLIRIYSKPKDTRKFSDKNHIQEVLVKLRMHYTVPRKSCTIRLHEYFPITEFFWSVFSHIRSEYGEKRSISPYSVRIRENTYQKKLRIWTLFT